DVLLLPSGDLLRATGLGGRDPVHLVLVVRTVLVILAVPAVRHPLSLRPNGQRVYARVAAGSQTFARQGRAMPGRPHAAAQLAFDTEDMLKSPTRSGGIAVRVNQSLHSRGRHCSRRPICAIRPSRSTGDSLNRKLLTTPVTSPPSTRYTPSRVSPVSSRDCGSTSRMYQRQVSSSPRSVDLVISSRPGASASPGPSMSRLSPGSASGSPIVLAECRVVTNRASTPSRTQSTGSTGSPLSKTDWLPEE